MSSTVNTLWLFIILTNTALPSTITVFEARAVAWRTCIADMPRASTSPLFSVHVCQLPGRVIAHIHVYKSAGTVIKAMITAACALLKGTYTKLTSQRALQQLLVVDDTRPKVLFSTHREPVRRFFSALAEVTRRGRMSAQAYARGRAPEPSANDAVDAGASKGSQIAAMQRPLCSSSCISGAEQESRWQPCCLATGLRC